MSTSTFTPVQITLNISDKVIQATLIKRKASLYAMTYNQNAKSLILTWVITHFASDGDGVFGDSLKSLIADITHENTADNTTIVDAATGIILLPNTDDSYGNGTQTTMGQYDWFNMMAETQPLMVHALIRQYGTAVNWDLV